MVPRSELQTQLEEVCDHVYFQPPPSVQMEYPAVVYQRASTNVVYADNSPYRLMRQYEVTLISRDPDEPIFNALVTMRMSRHDRHYVADNLNHDVFTIYS